MAGTRRQHGYTLLLTLLVLLVGGASLFVAARDPGAAANATKAAEVASRLEAARDAVMAYALAGGTNNIPGALPCVDTDMPGNGESNSIVCTDANTVYTGWLPWRTIDTSRDSGSLWYVIDSDFRDELGPAPGGVNPLNVADLGSLQLDGQSGFAALIIDPGEPRDTQTDRGSPTAALGDYLDGENADGDTSFENCFANPNCNDRILGISADRLFQSVQRRAMAKTREVLQDFYSDKGHFPYAADFSSGIFCEIGTLRGLIPMHDGTCGAGESLSNARFGAVNAEWVTENAWERYIVYVVDTDCTAGGTCSTPALSLETTSGLAVVLGGSGTELASLGQDRSTLPTRTIEDYLESPENTDGDDIFDDLPLAENEDNDVLTGFVAP